MYKALLQQRGYRAANLALLGDSAGGGMVAALALRLAREGLPQPAALGMMSPSVEMQGTLDTRETLIAVDPLLPYLTGDASFALAYVGGDKTLYSNPLVSPLRGDYTEVFAPNKSSGGRPPNVLIQVRRQRRLVGSNPQRKPSPGSCSNFDSVVSHT